MGLLKKLVTAVLGLQLVVICFSYSQKNDTLKDVRFLVIGDCGGLPFPPYFTKVGKTTAAEMAKVTQSLGVDFILNLGDNFYYHGVKDVNDFRFKESFETVFADPAMMNIPWYVIAGNHDHLGNVSAQMAYSQRSRRWRYPYYYYDLQFRIPSTNASITILMIDTVLLCGNTYNKKQPGGPENVDIVEKQISWITKKLKDCRSEFLIVAGHYPVWSIGHHGPTNCLIQILRPLLKKYKVTAYFSGHDHNLQLIKEDDGIAYIVSGSGNFVDKSVAHEYEVPHNWLHFFNANISTLGGFVHVKTTSEEMIITYIQPYGMQVFQSVLPKRKL
ncbi:tartrate-resistant acid phosphatase type 5-like [Protopterus annectens]|uniref:tartrate-resistant acid phosphatase type 5-like n=1 Tax=Protopterus annectens TaxID=7888 RepID=UPI001CFB9A27|nr:tartrate-resistant acid phosphatase type 5-like [Protopterus annectens]XP_043940804.1 tartrate-resistant acid phosphatase type 5-like [Protopterus annectens]